VNCKDEKREEEVTRLLREWRKGPIMERREAGENFKKGGTALLD
jgi:hypothetical protein